MKTVVLRAPMSSMILLTDLDKEDVGDRAEGYGILGHVRRAEISQQLPRLLKRHADISQALSSLKR
jgi:hypothetical protein